MKYVFGLKRTAFMLFISLVVWMGFLQSCMRMRISDHQAKRRFIEADLTLVTDTIYSHNFILHYAKCGNDSLPTLFFIHGSPGSWDAFMMYMQDRELLTKYRMVSIDRPGFGYSQFGDVRNLSDQSAIISPLFKKLQNGKPCYIIGHALGGSLSVKLVAENPATFTGMVLLAASVDPSQETPEKWRGFFTHIPFKYLLPGAFRPSNQEIWYLKKDVQPLAAQFAGIICDVWIIHGDNDNLVPVENAEYAKKMLVNAKTVNIKILQGAPHFIHDDPWYTFIKNVLLTVK